MTIGRGGSRGARQEGGLQGSPRRQLTSDCGCLSRASCEHPSPPSPDGTSAGSDTENWRESTLEVFDPEAVSNPLVHSYSSRPRIPLVDSHPPFRRDGRAARAPSEGPPSPPAQPNRSRIRCRSADDRIYATRVTPLAGPSSRLAEMGLPGDATEAHEVGTLLTAGPRVSTSWTPSRGEARGRALRDPDVGLSGYARARLPGREPRSRW